MRPLSIRVKGAGMITPVMPKGLGERDLEVHREARTRRPEAAGLRADRKRPGLC